MTSQSLPSRRVVLSSAGIAAVTLCLAGCSSGASATSGADSGPTTAKTTDIPVGGGKIVGAYVITQPKAGTFEAFGYLCTHQNLPVQQVSDAAIVCGRHGSTYSLADGSVLTGPATRGLTKATATVSGDTITVS
jgi:nitrite reductase/ring-hydroxylating ferredoxin subunit